MNKSNWLIPTGYASLLYSCHLLVDICAFCCSVLMLCRPALCCNTSPCQRRQRGHCFIPVWLIVTHDPSPNSSKPIPTSAIMDGNHSSNTQTMGEHLKVYMRCHHPSVTWSFNSKKKNEKIWWSKTRPQLLMPDVCDQLKMSTHIQRRLPALWKRRTTPFYRLHKTSSVKALIAQIKAILYSLLS